MCLTVRSRKLSPKRGEVRNFAPLSFHGRTIFNFNFHFNKFIIHQKGSKEIILSDKLEFFFELFHSYIENEKEILCMPLYSYTYMYVWSCFSQLLSIPLHIHRHENNLLSNYLWAYSDPQFHINNICMVWMYECRKKRLICDIEIDMQIWGPTVMFQRLKQIQKINFWNISK